MKNKALRILISVASVVSVIAALFLVFVFIDSMIFDIKRIVYCYQDVSGWESTPAARYIRYVIFDVIFILVGLCVPVCGVIAFLHVNFLSINGTKAEAEEKKAEREMQKKERERERKKQLLEKLKSELGEE